LAWKDPKPYRGIWSVGVVSKNVGCMVKLSGITMMRKKHSLQVGHGILMEIAVTIHSLTERRIRIIYVQLGKRRRFSVFGLKRTDRVTEFTGDSENPTSSAIDQTIFGHSKRGESQGHVILSDIVMVFHRTPITFIK